MTRPLLVINPFSLSSEHHLLRRLNDREPTTLLDAVARVVQLYPQFTVLGRAGHPSAAAMRAWDAIAKESWTQAKRQGGRHGLVLTGHGELRLKDLWHREVVTPYLRRVEHELGVEAARAAAAELARER
ncbi:hypothetical protein [Deinococcus multiflagellatus]|uniref:Uncharacterized protein n=1 Tax=Deinococcus multiflagellatus TaxID=1656887 RepID=A0ABW1ZRX6_9DEIO|nr:hypothetical protein [Deinococcus multiflagellatus]MBZ9715519.1 hypothetical protein [Deinococcus multiflagellatus]